MTSGLVLAIVLLDTLALTAVQVVQMGFMGRTVQSRVRVEMEASAIQQLGGVSVLLVGWVRPANKRVQGAATDCSAETHAAVGPGDCVTL